MTSKMINVELIYALPDEQELMTLSVSEDSTIYDVILKASIVDKYPELDMASMEVGLFGKLAKKDQKVRERDRIEIYRPLIADPKEVRKRRAAEGKKLKKGGSTPDKAKEKA